MKVLYIALLALLCSLECATASVVRFGIADGLSNAFVTAVTSDRHGAVWVGTESGLNRIADGRCERRERIDDIRTMYYDMRTDRLFVGMLGRGVCVVDCESLGVSWIDTACGLADNDVSCVARAADGGVWIVYYCGKIQHLDIGAMKFRTYDFRRQSGHTGTTQTCADDGSGRLYVGSSRGLGIMNVADGSVRNLTLSDGLPGNHVRTVFVDSRSNVWLGTERGLAVAPPGGNTFAVVMAGGKTPVGGNVFCISETVGGILLVAADMGGVATLRLDGFRPDSCRNVRPDRIVVGAGGLSSPHVRSVCQDAAGNVWAGNYGSGVDCLSGWNQPFRVFPVVSHDGRQLAAVTSLSVDEGGRRVWVGCGSTLMMMEDGRVVKSWAVACPDGSVRVSVVRVFADCAGDIWLGLADRGAVVFSPRTETFRAVDVGNVDVTAFCNDGDGCMLIGTECGLFRYDGSSVRRYGKLGDIIVTSMTKDSSGRLWLSTIGSGVVVATAAGTPLHSFASSSGGPDNVNMLFPAGGQEIWAATYGGLVRFNINGGRVTVRKYSQGSLDGMIYAVVAARYGYVWASTNEGLVWLNPSDGTTVLYDRSCGVPAGGLIVSAAGTAAGHLYFGSTEGLCVFDPLEAAAGRSIAPTEDDDGDMWLWVAGGGAVSAVAVLLGFAWVRLLSSRKTVTAGGDDTADGAASGEEKQRPTTRLDEDFLDRLAVLIDTRMASGHIDVASLAGEMGMSHSSFYRKVKGLTGMTANESVRKRRMARAAELLREGYNISETMARTGFNSGSYFRECFRAEYGMLPSEYARNWGCGKSMG